MRTPKNTNIFILLAIFLLVVTISAYSATPEKPYPALSDGDRLQASWLMGMFNVLYDWAQTTNNSFTIHVASSTVHGLSSAVAGIADTQSLTNKTLDSSNSISGDAVKSGTVADARIASTLARDSEVTTAVTNHNAVITAHGATGAIMGTTNTQTVTNKAMSTGCTWGGTAVPVANGGTGATTAATALTNLGLTSTAAEINLLDGVTATTAEINYVDGVTSAIQTQINAKAASTHTHNYAGSASAGGAASSVASTLTRGTGLTGNNFNGSAATTWAVSYGTTAGTACQGNDARLSDARTPTTHTHNYAGSASAGGAATSALTATTATTATTASTANAIRTSAPASPANGDIWTE